MSLPYAHFPTPRGISEKQVDDKFVNKWLKKNADYLHDQRPWLVYYFSTTEFFLTLSFSPANRKPSQSFMRNIVNRTILSNQGAERRQLVSLFSLSFFYSLFLLDTWNETVNFWKREKRN